MISSAIDIHLISYLYPTPRFPPSLVDPRLRPPRPEFLPDLRHWASSTTHDDGQLQASQRVVSQWQRNDRSRAELTKSERNDEMSDSTSYKQYRKCHVPKITFNAVVEKWGTKQNFWFSVLIKLESVLPLQKWGYGTPVPPSYTIVLCRTTHWATVALCTS